MRHGSILWAVLIAIGLILSVTACSAPISAPSGGGGTDSPPPAARPEQAQQPAPATPAPAKPAAPAKLVKVRMAQAVDTLGYGTLYLAARKGFFAELGLDVERTTVGGGVVLSAAFLNGDADIISTATAESSQLTAAGKGAIVVYALDKTQPMHMAVSNKFISERGIDIKADLRTKVARMKGITLGAPSLGGTTEKFSRFVLTEGGLKDEEISVIKVGSGSAQVAALENGQIDGYVAGLPAPLEAVGRGKASIVIRPQEVPAFKNFVHDVVVTRTDYAEKNPEVVRKVTQALDKAKKYVQADLEGAVADLKKDFPKMDDASLRESLQFYRDAYTSDGKMSRELWTNTLKVVKAVNDTFTGALDPTEGVYWTNQYQQ